jgi:PAS domain S-box-containing protein
MRQQKRIQGRQGLLLNEQSLQILVETIPALVWRAKPNGHIDYVNKRLLEYFGSPLEEIIGWGWMQKAHPDDVGFKVQSWLTNLEAMASHDVNCRFQGADGAYRWFNVRGEPLRDSDGSVQSWYGVFIDIDNQTKARERLRQLEADLAHMNRLSMMGELSASLAHEIKQPIATARNNASAALNFLDKQLPDLGEVREALDCIVGDADRAAAIIDRIRDQIKKVPPQKHRFDLNEAINEVIVLARTAIAKNVISVDTHLREGELSVEGDRVQLQQVLLNLILNAVEAMGSVEARARELLISTEQDHTGVLVAVRDSGPGIDATHLERVFEAFYTTKSSGVGMGLSICRSIIDAHGGRLWAEPNEPRGAVFQFTLPSIDSVS